MSSPLTLAAVLPTFRRATYLAKALESLFRQRVAPTEILVVDQTPLLEYDPFVVAFLTRARNEGRIRWIRLQEPAVSKARNHAALESQCDVLLYLDDDIVASEHLVEAHLRHYEDPDVHAVVGQALPADPDLIRRLPIAPSDFERLPLKVQAFSDAKGRLDRPLRQVGFMYAGNFSIRRRILIEVGGWDEHIINYGDRDLGLRLVAAGFRIDYDPEALLWHYASPSGGTRVTDPRTPWTGWQRCVSLWYVAFRHLDGIMFLRYGAWRAARFSFLLRENFLRAWRWPAELWAYCKAFWIARSWAREGVKSPFALSRASTLPDARHLGSNRTV